MRGVREIKEDLNKVEIRIKAKQKLITEHPNDTGLKYSLLGFKNLKDTLTRELKHAQDWGAK